MNEIYFSKRKIDFNSLKEEELCKINSNENLLKMKNFFLEKRKKNKEMKKKQKFCKRGFSIFHLFSAQNSAKEVFRIFEKF